MGLIGCDQWDEAAERAVCNNANPRDPTKAQACYNSRKLAYDGHLAKLRNAEEGIGMSVSDVDRFRKEAEEARRQAERAISSLDKEEWLRVAAEWIKLALDAEKRRSQD